METGLKVLGESNLPFQVIHGKDTTTHRNHYAFDMLNEAEDSRSDQRQGEASSPETILLSSSIPKEDEKESNNKGKEGEKEKEKSTDDGKDSDSLHELSRDASKKEDHEYGALLFSKDFKLVQEYVPEIMNAAKRSVHDALTSSDPSSSEEKSTVLPIDDDPVKVPEKLEDSKNEEPENPVLSKTDQSEPLDSTIIDLEQLSTTVPNNLSTDKPDDHDKEEIAIKMTGSLLSDLPLPLPSPSLSKDDQEARETMAATISTLAPTTTVDDKDQDNDDGSTSTTKPMQLGRVELLSGGGISTDNHHLVSNTVAIPQRRDSGITLTDYVVYNISNYSSRRESDHDSSSDIRVIRGYRRESRLTAQTSLMKQSSTTTDNGNVHKITEDDNDNETIDKNTNVNVVSNEKFVKGGKAVDVEKGDVEKISFFLNEDNLATGDEGDKEPTTTKETIKPGLESNQNDKDRSESSKKDNNKDVYEEPFETVPIADASSSSSIEEEITENKKGIEFFDESEKLKEKTTKEDSSIKEAITDDTNEKQMELLEKDPKADTSEKTDLVIQGEEMERSISKKGEQSEREKGIDKNDDPEITRERPKEHIVDERGNDTLQQLKESTKEYENINEQRRGIRIGSQETFLEKREAHDEASIDESQDNDAKIENQSTKKDEIENVKDDHKEVTQNELKDTEKESSGDDNDNEDSEDDKNKDENEININNNESESDDNSEASTESNRSTINDNKNVSPWKRSRGGRLRQINKIVWARRASGGRRLIRV